MTLPMHARLCYIRDAWAWFTTCEPFEAQTGDDWNDDWYVHNASEPCAWEASMAVAPYDLVCIAFRCDLSPADEQASVDAINRRAMPWLETVPYSGRGHPSWLVRIWAGTPLSEFIATIRAEGGTIYLPMEDPA